MSPRLRFILLYFALVPAASWLVFYTGSMVYFWITGRGGPDSAFQMACGGVLTHVFVLLLNWKQVLRRLL